jgi:hypothetical protein
VVPVATVPWKTGPTCCCSGIVADTANSWDTMDNNHRRVDHSWSSVSTIRCGDQRAIAKKNKNNHRFCTTFLCHLNTKKLLE